MENTSLSKSKIEPLDMDAYQQKKCKWSQNVEHITEDPHYHPQVYNNLTLESKGRKFTIT
jgi:hypothetical protein